jgi:tellurite resistance protein
MEFLGIIVLIIIYVFFGQILRAFFASLSAGLRTLIHGGSFKENFGIQFFGMELFELKGEHTPISEDVPFDVLELKGKGLLPIKKRTNIAFITSIVDMTDGEPMPVLAALDDFQEAESRAFQHQVFAGQANPDSGFISWVRVGAVIPSLLIPPKSGLRDLVAITRMVDADNPPPINLGYSDSKHPGYITSFEYSFEENFSEQGYQEEAENRAEARGLIIMLGVLVAMADGDFAEEEGKIIKDWIIRSIATYSDDRREELKKDYNKAFKDGYEKAKKGTLSISEITDKLDEIASKSQKYEAIDLCFDVMAADGVADEEELNVIKNISKALDLDFNEIQKMKDQRLIKLSTAIKSQSSVEAMLGIDPDWSPDQIQKHLRSEFTKWNGRLNTLPDGEERENAQRMLNLIAEARKKYAEAA